MELDISLVVIDLIAGLKTKLTLAFAFITVVSVLLISILANFLLEKQFRAYVMQKHQNRNKEIALQTGQQYTGPGQWKMEVLENIGVTALEEGLIVRVVDGTGNVIWDAMTHNSGLCLQMISHMTNNMTSRYPRWKGGYQENSYPVMSGLTRVGTIEIGYYGPFFFNDHELDFLNTLNKAIMWVGALALLFSVLFAIFISGRLTTPIAKVIRTARMISKGNYQERINENSSTREIQELTSTINHLAGTLQTQELLRKRLTSDVAHELRTPMSTLQSHLEAMIDGIWQPTTERLRSCHEEIIRINKMVGDIGALARYEGENLSLSKTRFSITEHAGTISMNFEGAFKSKGVELSYGGDDVIVEADKDKISQVLVNLISNSLKYTPTGGRVEIAIRDTPSSAAIIIKDNGVGISEEDLPHIFERFYRADKSRNRMTGGTGIGLTISKAILEAHGGTIEASSKIGVGTEFLVFLPKAGRICENY